MSLSPARLALRMLPGSSKTFVVRVMHGSKGPKSKVARLLALLNDWTLTEDGRVKMTDETFETRGPVVISSIGSIPEPIEGINMNGELFDFQDWDIGRLESYPTVFSVGNVVTGRGNIVASRKHATHVSEAAIEAYLGFRNWSDQTS